MGSEQHSMNFSFFGILKANKLIKVGGLMFPPISLRRYIA